MFLIGIDVGTTGTKTVLFRQDGSVVASHSVEYPMEQPKNGWAQQDPALWVQAALEGLRAVSAGVDPAAIAGIGLSGQMHGLVLLDDENKVIRPAILWCDSRTDAQCEQITRLVGEERLLEITACPALPGFTASKILWVRENEPELYARVRKILLPKDYVRFCLTGTFATDVSDASGTQLLDIAARSWSGEVLQALSIDPALLPPVYESAQVVGTLTETAAAQTGLRAGIPVVAGAGDNAAAAVGTGVVENGKAFVTIGTSGVVYAHTDKMQRDPKGRVHTFCCAVPGAWHVMGVTQAAGLSLKWTRDTLCEGEIAHAAEQGIDPYVLMDCLAETSPIGANRLLFLPYLMAERTPHLDADCRGAFFGLSAMHTRADLIRAVLEGVTYSLRDCLEVLRQMQVCPTSMAACGGGSVSPLWRAMLADVFSIPIHTLQSQEGPALGAAILAGVGAGLYESVPSACGAILQQKGVCLPDAEKTAAYERVYNLYVQLYPQLKTLYKQLKTL